MNKIKIWVQLFLLSTFLAGIYVVAHYDSKEGLENKAESTCPNLLVKKGNVLMLYNTDKPVVDSENPIPFFNLDEYINYLEIQRKKGIQCPVLFLQQESDAQGNNVYRARPSPFDLQGGLPATTTLYKENAQGVPVIPILDASRDNKPYNQNLYAGFDPTGLYQGTYTELDKIHDSTTLDAQSDNPMDANWGGVMHTEQQVDSGKYDENNIYKPVLFNPKVAFDPTMPNTMPPPKDIIEPFSSKEKYRY